MGIAIYAISACHIIRTTKAEEANKIIRLEIGTDDYLAKSFSPDELVARIKAVRRRLASALVLPWE